MPGPLDRARQQGRAAPAGATPYKSKYKDLSPRGSRSAFLDDPGQHTVEILGHERVDPEADDPWLKVEVKFEEVDSRAPHAKVNDTRTVRRKLTGKSKKIAIPEMITLAMACYGFTDKQEAEFYEAIRPAGLTEDFMDNEALCGLMIDAIEGEPEACEFCVEGVNDGKPIFPKNFLAGAKVRVRVSPVPPTPEYPNSKICNYDWSPVPQS